MKKLVRSFVWVLVAGCGGGKSTAPVEAPEIAPSDGGLPEEAAVPVADAGAPLDAAPPLTSEEMATQVTAESVGPFRIGMKVKEAREVKKAKVVEVKKSVEGEMEKVLSVVDGEKTLLEFATKSGKLSAITVLDRRYRTEKGIALGAKASAVEAAYGAPTGQYTLEGETCFFFSKDARVHFCFRAGPKGWESFAKKGKPLTTLIVSEK